MAKKETAKKEKAAKKSGGKQPKKEEKAVISRYFEAKGGRKTAIAQVRLFTNQKGIIVNGRDYKNYFLYLPLQKEIIKPLELMNVGDKFGVSAKVRGGGMVAQAEAVRHGIAKALTVFNSDFRKRLKRAGLLTRDPRMVERKKYGLKKARRAPQWAKR